MNKRDFYTIAEFAVKIILIFAIIYFIYDAFSVFMPIVLSIFLSVVLDPIVDKIKQVTIFGKTIHINRTLAIVLVILALCMVCVIVMFFIIMPLNKLIKGLPDLIGSFTQSSSDFTSQVQALDLPSEVEELIKETLIIISDYVVSLLKSAMSAVISFAQNILGFLIMPILVFYFIKDGKALCDGFVGILPKSWQAKTYKVLKESAQMISDYTRGIFLIGLISGSVVGFGTAAIGLEYWTVFAVLAMLAEAVPIVGPIICSLPAVLYATSKGVEVLVIIVIFYFVYYKIDAYFIVPRITGKILNLHPVLIIISILIGGKFAGALGMIFAVPAFALMRVLSNNIIEQEENEDEKNYND